MDNLNNLLNKFSEITDKVIENLENEEYDQVNLSLENREKIINEIKNIDYAIEEFKSISLSLNLEEKEKKLNSALEEKFNEKKEVLDRISKAKHANSEYKKAYSVDSIFINKKI